MGGTASPGLEVVPHARDETGTEALERLRDGFAAAWDRKAVVRVAVREVSATLRCAEYAVHVVLPDRSGRLMPMTRSSVLARSGRMRSARRRLAFESHRTLRFRVRSPGGHDLLVVPFVCRGESLGVLEVVAPRPALDRHKGRIEAVAAHAAMVLFLLGGGISPGRDLEAFGRNVKLLRDVWRAGSPGAATRAAMAFCFGHFGLPVAAWCSGNDPSRLELLGVRGLGRRGSRSLREQLPTLPPWTTLSSPARAHLEATFERITGVDRVGVIDAGNSLLLVAGAGPERRGSFETLAGLLGDALAHRDAVATAWRRNQHLDLGLAWTAHELRGPILAIRAAIDRLLASGQLTGEGKRLLVRSRRELYQLAAQADALLRWAAGDGPLRMRRTDLGRVARRAVETSVSMMEERRVDLEADPDVFVKADARHLRSAIANLVRNALDYSPPGSRVRVVVGREDHRATVTVTDRGPGVSPSEREAIFDPFVRGSMASSNRGGRGLGLFVTRRVVEAHGGAVWLESGDGGTSFRLQLPSEGVGK
jgi:signal transduction histidine kinase